MQIIAVDDEELALERLVNCIQRGKPEAAVQPFANPRTALEYARSHPVDVAFLDIEMGEFNGIDLAKELKALLPTLNIIFVTVYDSYSIDAFSVYASGYILKPYSVKDIVKELDNLRYPITEKKTLLAQEKELTVQCFGHFKARRNGAPITFKYSKTSELLAYLIDRRGALCSGKEIIATLFEDDDKEAYYQKLRADLMENLPENLIITRRGYIGINIKNVSCDYYDYLDGKRSAANAYNGEYMSQYEWAIDHFSWRALSE